MPANPQHSPSRTVGPRSAETTTGRYESPAAAPAASADDPRPGAGTARRQPDGTATRTTVAHWHDLIPTAAVCRDRIARLSHVEWTTLNLLMHGFPVKEIARVRGVSVKTTRNQINSALRVLDVQRVNQAIAVILRADLARR